MTQHRHFEVETHDGVTVIRLVDPRLFDTLIISELEDELVAFLEQARPPKVLVSFERVTHCSTSVINALLRAKKRIIATNGQLRLCGMIDRIRDAHRTLNLDGTVFDIYDTADEALESF